MFCGEISRTFVCVVIVFLLGLFLCFTFCLRARATQRQRSSFFDNGVSSVRRLFLSLCFDVVFYFRTTFFFFAILSSPVLLCAVSCHHHQFFVYGRCSGVASS